LKNCSIFAQYTCTTMVGYIFKPILILVMFPLKLETTELLDDCSVCCRQVHKHNGSKNKHDDNYTYLLEPFGGQVFESGPNNTKHVTCNRLTLHKQTKDRFPSVFMLLVYAATRDVLQIEIYIFTIIPQNVGVCNLV
jgi:hypothetical protein